MKAHEVRGLPVAEIKTMVVDAETNLVKMRFQNAVGQLEQKTQVGKTKKEIAILKTVLREESLKAELAQAAKVLAGVLSKFKIEDVRPLKGAKSNLDKSALRRAVKQLHAHPKRREFMAEYSLLKVIANK